MDVGILMDSLQGLFSLKILLLFVGGCLAGMIIGALPGLTTTMGITLLITFTWGMNLLEALTLIISLHVGGTYGGSTSAIFLNIPGTPAAAATAMDGYPMAQRGEGGLARGIATIQSSIGTIIATLIFIFATPLMVKFSMNFGSWEYCILAIFGVVINANVTSGAKTKALMAGVIGLMLSTFGIDAINGVMRYNFGFRELLDGFPFIAVLIGLFGMAEVIDALSDLKPPIRINDLSSVVPPRKMLLKFQKLALRSSVIGAFIGAIPGVGADVACWVAYDDAKRNANPDDEYAFGKGNPNGVVAAETANNACVPGTYIPMLTLGIPGDSVTAVILGGLTLHGLQPGPRLLQERGELIYQFAIILMCSAVVLLILGLLFSALFQKILLLPKSAVLIVVSVLCVVGTYAINRRLFDVGLMFVFGLLGYVMRKNEVAAPPLVLGLLLGPLAEMNFRRAMMSADYSFLPFITRPISLAVILFTFFVLVNGTRWYVKTKTAILTRLNFHKG